MFCVDDEEPIDVDMRAHSIPPGRWRVGCRPWDKSELLLFRFSTIQDVKLAGAQYESDYYRKYGNPNFGGLPGLISQSRKRRMGMAHIEEYSEGLDLRRRLDTRKILKLRRRSPSPNFDNPGKLRRYGAVNIFRNATFGEFQSVLDSPLKK